MVEIPSFNKSQLLTQALTHRSYFNEHPDEGKDNERLEFLGDAVLKFVIALLLYQRYPEMREGELTRLRSALENNTYQLANFAKQLNLDQLIRLGKGAELEGNRQNKELLGDVFEAFIAAYLLDTNLDSLINFLNPLLIPIADKLANNSHVKTNIKGELQEWALENIGENPEYVIVEEYGLQHAKNFKAEVRIKGKVYGIGKGKSKKIAEKKAAEMALEQISDHKFESIGLEQKQNNQDKFSHLKLNILKKISQQMNRNICDNCSDPSYCLAHNICLHKSEIINN
jgi:ribonuclease-3